MIPTTISVGGFTEVDPTAVHKTGAETVAGVKTFSSAPVVPDGSFTEAKTVGLIPVTQKAATSGVASLDTSGWVPPTQLGNSAPVNVKSRGATGLGVADDYTALQALIAAGNIDVLFPPGTYNISNTLTPGPNTNITFADGAVLRGHSTVSGTLDSAWRHIYVNGVDNVTIMGLTLGTPLDTPAGIGGLELGIMVYVVDSTNVRIEGGVADWNSYANHPAGALNFCWFKGTSKYCRVTGCYLTGIGYIPDREQTQINSIVCVGPGSSPGEHLPTDRTDVALAGHGGSYRMRTRTGKLPAR